MQYLSTNTPDSLQDLCIFYCVENLKYLNLHTDREAGTHFSDEGGGDAVSSPDHELPVTLCDKLVTQFLTTCIPENQVPPYNAILHNLLKRKNVCSQLNLLRREILAEANICDISNSYTCIISVNLFGCSEYSYRNSGIELLMKHNKSNIKNLRVYGVFGSLDDLDDTDTDYYSIVPDPPGAWSIHVSSLTNNTSPTGKGDGEIEFSIRDISANKRFLVTRNISKLSGEEEDVTLLHSDGCYRQTKASDDISWYWFPNLSNFTVINTDTMTNIPSDLIIWNTLVSNPQLTAVCIVSADVSVWWPNVSKLRYLTNLVLSSSSPRQRERPISFFQYLTGLENLRHLDVSTAAESNYMDAEVEEFAKYVQSAPGLTSLEIAGTNLSMILGHHQQCSNNREFNPVHCLEDCMAPLGNRKFQYLGLINCPYTPYMHKHIPAAKVSGLNGGKQVLIALWSYQHNLGLMGSVLDYMTELFSHPEEQDSELYPGAYIEGLLAFLDQYPDWKCIAIQQPTLKITGKILYQLYKMLALSHRRHKVTIIHKRRLLERMLVLIGNCLRDIKQDFHSYVDYVSRLSLVVLLCLPLPEVAVYCYMLDKYVKTLILVVERRPKPMIMHLALRLIHTACRYSQDLKARIGGEFRLTKILLSLISDNRHIDDDVDDVDLMETVIEKSWSIIWTLTDEVPSNCAKFIEYSGLEISKDVIELNPSHSYELHRKITGALSNVAENPELRPSLCRQDLAVIMQDMLKIDTNGIDVSSHAAAFLVLLAADGPEAWTVEDPTREEILTAVEKTIDQWKLDTSRGVKFRSLSPMTQQMENSDTPVAQYWACWMICNLIIVKPARYCLMLREEGGIEVLDRLNSQPDLYIKVKELVSQITDIMEKNKDIVVQDDDDY